MTLFQAFGQFAGQAAVAPAGAPGMVLMKPTSITHSGTSATLGANGQVTFSAITSLSLNGCFTADFDNYVVSVRHVSSTTGPNVGVRLRAAGSDASGTDYTRQYFYFDDTALDVNRNTSQTIADVMVTANAQRSGDHLVLYGPYLAQPTAMRANSANGYSSGFIRYVAATHSLSTSYDGFTMVPGSGTLTGAVTVYGLRS